MSRLTVSVTAIDAAARHVVLTDETLVYGALVLATGATVRQLPAAAGLPCVHLLRTPDDAIHLRQVMGTATSAIIIGGGYWA